MTLDDQPPNSSRSTACRSFGSKNFAAHLSLVPRNQPAATAAVCFNAAGFAPRVFRSGGGTIEKVEVIHQRQRLDREHRRNILVMDRQQIVAIHLLALERQVG